MSGAFIFEISNFNKLIKLVIVKIMSDNPKGEKDKPNESESKDKKDIIVGNFKLGTSFHFVFSAIRVPIGKGCVWDSKKRNSSRNRIISKFHLF